MRTAFADPVLAQLEANTWPTGAVRSSITLLTYAEDALLPGGRMLQDGIAAMRSFVQELLSRPDLSFIDPPLCARLQAALAADPCVATRMISPNWSEQMPA